MKTVTDRAAVSVGQAARPLRGTREGFGDPPARRVVGKDVSLEPDFAFGGVDGAFQRREILLAAPQ